MYAIVGKRLFDFVFCLLFFLASSPVFFLLLFSLVVVNKGSPFFYQDRPGKNGKVFKIIKFKTMKDTFDPEGRPFSDAERMTKMGEWIRKRSLDELPQLINVLKGDMSMVGPRPLLVEYLNLYSKQQGKRHLVKPGITGWAQINGRNAISWQKKFQLDVWYVENQDFFIDVKILLHTFGNVVKGKGVSQRGHVSIEKFAGNSYHPTSFQ